MTGVANDLIIILTYDLLYVFMPGHVYYSVPISPACVGMCVWSLLPISDIEEDEDQQWPMTIQPMPIHAAG